MPAAPPPAAALALLLKGQRRRLVAHLARRLGLVHLALAEDAVQAASLRAFEVWPAAGVPANPAGWLYRVAHHHALDQLRHAGRQTAWPEDDAAASERAPDSPDPTPMLTTPAPTGRFAGELDDDELALVFAACHPAVPQMSQVAIALRALAGLELAAIAEGLFCSEAALAQRLARARAALQDIEATLPAGAELPPRREAVLCVLMLMFNAGLQASGRQGERGPGGTPGTAPAHDPMAMCWEAIRLARALAAHPAAAHADADATAALLLFHGARLTGRLDAAGDIIPLPGQPRDRWDAGMVRMGFVHLQAAQRAGQLSRWHLLAGIAAEHAMAADYASTDWPAITGYYDLLLRLDPSAAPRLGHAIALAEAGDAARARSLLQAMLADTPAPLRAHTLAALARAEHRLGRRTEAREHYAQAILQARHPADARLLARHLAELDGEPHTGV